MTFDIDIILPTARLGAGVQAESIGPCAIITKNVFATVTEASGEAHLVPLDEITELDRTQPRYSTSIGRSYFPRRIDLPDTIYVETPTGHARAIKGDQIARLVRARGR